MDASYPEPVDDRFDDRTNARKLRLARALGLFSLGLGTVQVAAPSSIARATGVDDGENDLLIRAIGFREIGQGLSLLWSVEPAPLLWSRVAGDAMDLSMLAKAYAAREGDRDRRRRIVRAMGAVAAVTVPDVIGGIRTSGSMDGATDPSTGPREEGVVRGSITVARSPEDVYGFWRRLTNLPRFMTHLDSVSDIGDGRTRWRANGPANASVEWDAEIVEDVPNGRIAWRSVPPSQIDNEGSVEFRQAPRGAGTEVSVRLSYAPPAGAVGRIAAKLLGEEPKQQVSDDLRRFKQLMETGDIVRSEASPEGTRTTRMIAQRPARPMAA